MSPRNMQGIICGEDGFLCLSTYCWKCKSQLRFHLAGLGDHFAGKQFHVSNLLVQDLDKNDTVIQRKSE